ncbi:MAG: hypothetical protein KGK18_13335, partial [Burkholderiales bacterium]|nr:hypothetical protein [Burkholderiales bacterium]
MNECCRYPHCLEAGQPRGCPDTDDCKRQRARRFMLVECAAPADDTCGRACTDKPPCEPEPPRD